MWCDNALKLCESDYKNSVEQRIRALRFLCDVWILFPQGVEDIVGLINSILDRLKKGARDHSETLKLSAYNLQFLLLDNFAQMKNPQAALIYKKLTFYLMENHADISLREFILRNFHLIFKKYQTIPCEIIMEPLVKQIQVSEQMQSYQLNICDIEFFHLISSHPKLQLKEGVPFFDLLSKIYLNDLVWAKPVFSSISQLLSRFIESEGFQQYTIKLVKIALAIYFTSCKNRRARKQQYYNQFQV